MANLNKVFIIGNLTRDPVLRVIGGGTSVCDFGLAINRHYKDDEGHDKEETTYVDIESWGSQAETLQKYVAKGDPLFVEGRLRFDQWEDKTTHQKRSRLKVILVNFQFLGRSKGNAAAGAAAPEEKKNRAASSAKPKAAAVAASAAASSEVDDDQPY